MVLSIQYIDIGKPKTLVWTLLNNSIEIGDNSLLLNLSVSWNAGDLIVVASSDFDYKYQKRKQLLIFNKIID